MVKARTPTPIRKNMGKTIQSGIRLAVSFFPRLEIAQPTRCNNSPSNLISSRVYQVSEPPLGGISTKETMEIPTGGIGKNVALTVIFIGEFAPFGTPRL